MAAQPLSNEEWERCQQALEQAGGNITQAAVALGISRTTLSSRILAARAQGRAADGCLPDGYKVKGVSTLYDWDGTPMLTWVKTGEDAEKQEQILRETLAEFIEAIPPATPTIPPERADDLLCVAYCIGDAHIGLYSWGAEVGADFDLQIAKDDLMGAADRLVASVPPADECLIVQLGDFFHSDDSKAITPKSGNRLDVDSRFPKIVRVGINTLRHIINRALEKHRTVRVRNVAGNHDPHSYIILVEALKGYYVNEPRVIIEDSPKPFWSYRFGSCLIGMTHGHMAKPEKYPGMLAVEAQADWGECAYRYVYHGHIHNKRVIDEMGVMVESFRTLAARDAWHAEMGYMPGREMQAIVLHKDFGEIERHTASLKRARS